MTNNEFSEKYNIPYHIVYQASLVICPPTDIVRDPDCPEQEMYKVVWDILHKRFSKHAKQANDTKQLLIYMKETRNNGICDVHGLDERSA